MKVKEKIRQLLIYYGTCRRVGHTALMKEGTNHYEKEKLVLTHTMAHGEDLGFNHNEIVSWQNLEKLCGHSKPMVIDNYALFTILTETLKEIEKLEEENRKLMGQKEKILRILNE